MPSYNVKQLPNPGKDKSKPSPAKKPTGGEGGKANVKKQVQTKMQQKKAPTPKSTGLPPSSAPAMQADAKNTKVRPMVSQSSAQAVEKVPISVSPDMNVLLGLCTPWIEFAISRGWKDREAYQATYAIMNEMVTAMQGGKASSSVAPQLFWDLYDGLAPASSSKNAYSWSFESWTFPSLPAPFAVGLNPSGSSTPDSSGLVPFYNDSGAPAIPTYQPTLAAEPQAALQLLWKFYDSLGGRWKSVDYVPNKFYRDSVSAYAACVTGPTPFADSYATPHGSIGIEGENTIPWLAQLGIANTNLDEFQNPRFLSRTWTRYCPGRSVLAHRIVNGMTGKYGISQNVKMKAVSMDDFIYTTYNILTKAANVQWLADGDPDSGAVSLFTGTATNEFAFVLIGYIRNYYSKFSAVTSGLVHQNTTGLVSTPVSDWNFSLGVYDQVGMPAVVVEALRSLSPIEYPDKQEWVYPVFFLSQGFLTTFNQYVAADESNYTLATANSNLGGLNLEPTTGHVTAAPSTFQYNMSNGNVFEVVNHFSQLTAALVKYVDLYSGLPSHHQVELTLMHYVQVLTPGLETSILETKKDRRWNSLTRPSIFERGSRSRKEVSLKRRIWFRYMDKIRGVHHVGHELFDKEHGKQIEKLVAENTRTSTNILTLTRIAIASGIEFVDSNFKSDSMFQMPFFVTVDPLGADASGYYKNEDTILGDPEVQQFVVPNRIARNLGQVHPYDAEDNTEDGTILRERAKMGLGAGASSSSLSSVLGNFAKSGVDLITHFF